MVRDGDALPWAGYCGQRLGEVNAEGPSAIRTMRDNVASDITQWCVPLRRQQAGSDA